MLTLPTEGQGSTTERREAYRHSKKNAESEIDTDSAAARLATHDAQVAACAGRIMFMRDGKTMSEMRLPKDSPPHHDDRRPNPFPQKE